MPDGLITRVLAVRHGETAWNIAGRMQGHLDSDLDASGQAQADALGRRLAAETIHCMYASDLGRTVETAQRIVACTAHAVTLDPGLRERHLGVFQGLTGSEAQVRHPEHWARFRARDPDHDVDGGESLRAFSARVNGAAARLAAAHPGQTLLLVTHGGALDVMYRHATGLALEAPRNFTLLNASLNEFHVRQGRWTVVHWGDVEHLGVRDAIDDV
ncbi:MAG: histidine phosphatase family protein [Betaproteobacteria bacterium]|nr:histidine phosphatase family protein [Betaproteobacteria bacterium]